jgi:hypothetical protein
MGPSVLTVQWYLIILALAVITGLSSTAAHAELSVGAHHLNSSIGSSDFDAIGLSAAYKFSLNDKWSLVPELRYIEGYDEDYIKVDALTTVALKLEYQLTANSYAYVAPSYADIEITPEVSIANGQQIGFSTSEKEFGAIVGVGYQLNPQTAIELSYEDYDLFDGINVALRYSF